MPGRQLEHRGIAASRSPVPAAPGASASKSRSPALVSLQQTIGNHAVQKLLGTGAVQAKLAVSHPRDICELEADRVADQVMRMPGPPTSAAASPALHTVVQAKHARPAGTGSIAMSPDLYRVLDSAGQHLDPDTRTFMESRFGQDFSRVRIHTDPASSRSAEALNALAYTAGHHVVFRAGLYSPQTAAGRHLLAHELTHLVQQGAAAAIAPGRGTQPGRAEAAGPATLGRRPGSPGAASGFDAMPTPVLMRQVAEEESAEPAEEEPGFWGTIGGGLMGEFNEDPTFAMIGVDVGVSLVPILDQASDIRDIVAHLYYLIVRRQYDRFMRWLGLVFTLIGLIPELGSAIKGASKFIIRGVRQVLVHLDEILQVFRRILPEVVDIGRLQAYIARHWNRIVETGLAAWRRTVDRITELVHAIPAVLGTRLRSLRDRLDRVRAMAPVRLREAFAWVRRKWDEVMAQVRERLGLPATPHATPAPGLGPPPAGAVETRLSPAEYESALGRVFPSQFLNQITRTVDEIGDRAARGAVADPRFVQAVQSGNWTLAGTLFHSAAAREVRALPASALPAGWTARAEHVIQAGAGGSRADVLLRGPAGEVIEFDWKTTGRSALSSGSRREMTRHSGHITANIGGTLVTQESRSWVDFVRPLMSGVAWP